MMGTITHYGLDDRDHLVHFLTKFYAKNAVGAVVDNNMTPQVLGKNWSCFVHQRDGKNFLCLFDGDDGSGGTPSDCKLNWTRFQNIINHYKIADYVVFKIQHAPTSEARMFYPFKRDVYPLALMTNEPDRIFKVADELPKVEQDIDVLFVGGRVHDHNYPYCWPKNRNTNQHWPTNRRIGYAKLLEMKERRKDLNIVTYDGLMPPNEYYDVINRTKVCLDFPGIGVSSRKFYEFLVLGKCVLALPQNNCCWPLKEWEHYASMRTGYVPDGPGYVPDYDYVGMEKNIDHLLAHESIRADIGRRAAALRPLMSHEAVGEYVVKTLDEFVDSCLDGSIEGKRTTYE